MNYHRIKSIGAYKDAVRRHRLYVQVAAPRASVVPVTHQEGRRLTRQWLRQGLVVTVECQAAIAFLSARNPQPYRDEPPRWAHPGVLFETLL